MWDEKRILGYIQNQIQESLGLDYKAKGALIPITEKVKQDIAKDVSAMANSAGGVIIYGIAEYQEDDKKHLPEKVELLDFSEFSKERLEQIIYSGIQPKIDGILIHPIQIGQNSNQGVYVVEIPQSNTAHQVTKDYRYYKRYNFLSAPMEDYEIRDVMGRGQYPKIELEFEIVYYSSGYNDEYSYHTIKVYAKNNSKVFAQYVEAIIEVPDMLLPEQPQDPHIFTGRRATYIKNDILFSRYYCENLYDNLYSPILPTRLLRLNEGIRLAKLQRETIYWEVYADNSPPQKGQISIDEIKMVDMYGKPI